MLKKVAYFIACAIVFMGISTVYGADEYYWVEVNLRVRDGEFGESIVFFSFNDEELTLNKAKRLKSRRNAKVHIKTGSYAVKWSTRKISPTSSGEVIKHSKIITLGKDDMRVSINVQGHDIWVDRGLKAGAGLFEEGDFIEGRLAP